MQSEKTSHPGRQAAGVALAAWVILSLLVAASLAAVYQWKGPRGLEIVMITGPFSKYWLTFLSVLMTWLLGGLALALLSTGRIHAGNLLTWIGFFIVSILFLNLMRERLQYGDLTSYVLGATNLSRGEPFDRLYIYPPFFAMILQPLVGHGEETFLNVLWALNLGSLMLFYFLLHGVLERYGFSPRMAALAVTVFMVANMAMFRTMFYMQVNLHVLNLIFLSLLLYPRSRMLSALALALAVHLKASPLVLALPFLFERDWRWLAWLTFFGLFIFGVTLVSDGWMPYESYLYNLGLLNEPHGLNFRETSFDSFFWAIVQMLKLDFSAARIPIYISKVLLGLGTLFVLARSVRNSTFHQGEHAALFNALPPLLILMNMYSPLVWEHHGVFLVLAVFVLMKVLSTPAEWTWFGIFYFVQYLIPTFDFFPWSYARMLTPLILLWMLGRATTHPAGESDWFRRANQWLNELPALPAQVTSAT
ncbi:MAG: DUF2029 domain-containing protein [Chloroflexi bacterium]|nr:DUF2029 domain-containing protein [Chloroflexota bacterium]